METAAHTRKVVRYSVEKLGGKGRRLVDSMLARNETYAKIIGVLRRATGEILTDSSLHRYWRNRFLVRAPQSLDGEIRQLLEQIDRAEPHALYTIIVHRGRAVVVQKEPLTEERVSDIIKGMQAKEMKEIKTWRKRRQRNGLLRD